jgi:hypothetical protein
VANSLFSLSGLPWPLVLALILLAFPMIYYFAPHLLNRRWHWLTKDSDRSQVFLLWKLIVCNLALLLMISIPIHAQKASPDAQEENPARHLVTNGLVIKEAISTDQCKRAHSMGIKGHVGAGESLRRGVERRNGHGSESAQ